MKTLVLGDIHGRNCWKDIIEQECPDKVIFLGDYFSSHEDISEENQIENYKDILEFKRTSEIDMIMLRGNHDMEALKYNWAECSPCFRNNFFIDQNHKDEFLKNTQWIYIQDSIIFSHAGISENWLESIGGADRRDDLENYINKLVPNKLFGFHAGPDNPFDCYGDSRYQSCTWIRPEALIESAITGTHVVGHTGMGKRDKVLHLSDIVKEPVNEDEEGYKNTDVWCCDCLPNSYLVIEDGEFNVKIV